MKKWPVRSAHTAAPNLSRWLSGLNHVNRPTVPAGLHDGLARTLADLSTNPGLEGVFQLDWTSGHAMKLMNLEATVEVG